MSLLVITMMVGAAALAAIPGPALAQDNILLVLRTQDDIVLNGLANEDAWKDAVAANIEVERGSTTKSVEMRALYDEQYIYMTATWADESYSVKPQQWTLTGGEWDSAPHKEDRLSLLWNTDDPIIGFEQNKQACTAACHNDVFKTQSADEVGDLWQWLAARTNPSVQSPDIGWMDDLSLGNTGIVADDFTGSMVWVANSVFAHDDNESNVPFSEDDEPKWTEGTPPPIDDPEGYFLFRGFEREITPDMEFDDGTTLPGYMLSRPAPGLDRADIQAKGAYNDAKKSWTLEFKRKLVTGNDGDVAFDDLLNSYFFGLSIFDNQGGGVDTHYKSGLVTLRFEVPELAILSAGVSITGPIIGDEVNITTKVKNLGGYSTGLTVGLFLDDMDSEPIATKPYTEMASAFEEEFNFTWLTADVEPGRHTLYIVADSAGIISERDEDNNVMTIDMMVFPPIAEFKASDRSPEEGKTITLTAVVNNPSANNTSVTVVFYEGENLLDSQVHEIEAGSTLEATFDWKASKEGTYKFRAYLEGAEQAAVEMEVKVEAASPGPGLLLAALAIALGAGFATTWRRREG